MSTFHEDERPVLGPLRDDYKPTPDDRARVWTRLRATALSRAAAATEAPATSPSSRRVPWRIVFASSGLLALTNLVQYEFVGGSSERGSVEALSTRSSSNSSEAPKEGAPARASSGGSFAPEAPVETPASAEPAISVAIDTLPTAPRSGAALPAVGLKSSPTRPTAGSHPIARQETTASPPVDTLEEETRLLGTAARAVRTGDGAHALVLVEEHAQRFPRGQLVDERDVQRILALCSLGKTEEASRWAESFLAGRPSSSLTQRVERSCIRR